MGFLGLMLYFGENEIDEIDFCVILGGFVELSTLDIGFVFF